MVIGANGNPDLAPETGRLEAPQAPLCIGDKCWGTVSYRRG